MLGFSRATPGALLAILPATAYAVVKAYDADLLVDNVDFGSAAGLAQGRDVASALVLAVVAAVVLRGLALLLDHGVRRLPGPGRLPVAARAGAVAGVVVIALVVALAAGAPAWAERQVDVFLESAPAVQESSTDQRDRLRVFNSNGRVDHWKVALDSFARRPPEGQRRGHLPERVVPRAARALAGAGRPLAVPRDGGGDGAWSASCCWPSRSARCCSACCGACAAPAGRRPRR